MATQSYLDSLSPITEGSGKKRFRTLEEIAKIALGNNYSSTKSGQIIALANGGASDDVLRKNGVSSEAIPLLRAHVLYYKSPQEFSNNEMNYLKESILDKTDEFGNKSTASLADLSDSELNTIMDTFGKLQKLPEIQALSGTVVTPVGPGADSSKSRMGTVDEEKTARVNQLSSTVGKMVNSDLGSGYDANEIVKKINSGEISNKATLQSYVYKTLGKVYGERLSDSPAFRNLPDNFDYYKGAGLQSNKADLTSYDIPTTQRAISDILTDRANVASSKASAENFLNTAPDELAAERDAFFSGQRKRAKDYLSNDFASSTVEDLGVTGRPMSYAGDILASKAGELESSISAQQSEQEASDAALFADMSYQKTFQDLIDARGNVQSQVNYERTNLKQKQAQGFNTRQKDIQRNFDLSLFENQNADALKNYTAKLNKASTAAKTASEANTWSALGQTAAQVGGAAVVSKIPEVVG